VVPRKTGPQWLRVDIDAWLRTLDDASRRIALECIEPYVAGLERAVGERYAFTVPDELKSD
jgi:hypothetical protein